MEVADAAPPPSPAWAWAPKCPAEVRQSTPSSAQRFFQQKSDLKSQMFQRQRAPKMANWPFCGCHSSKKERGENLAKVVLERKRVEMLSAEMPGSWDQVVVLIEMCHPPPESVRTDVTSTRNPTLRYGV